MTGPHEHNNPPILLYYKELPQTPIHVIGYDSLASIQLIPESAIDSSQPKQ